MHQCPTFLCDPIPTDNFRFRQHPFTGRPILQILVIINQVCRTDVSLHHKEWRDASMDQAKNFLKKCIDSR